MANVSDRFWLWGHDAGSHNEGWNIPGKSRITPVEAAFYLAIPNIVMVRYNKADLPPSVQYGVPFRPLRQVVWSIVGASGITARADREQAIELAQSLSNMTGVMMDDFFRSEGKEDGIGVLSLDELRHVRDLLSAAHRKLDLWVVLYDHQTRLPVRRHLELCDKVTFWTWKAEDLPRLEQNFALAEAVAPSCGKLLGCYMWDYGAKRPMPVNLMQKQCEQGLQWLQEGRIEGMIFLASCICDLGLETVEWTRQWVAQVGGRPL
ncbi:MAG: hypothetical protein HYV35_07560 [Lentisphaerae bacterium]|nr:hypothetical protein [Lentisphaerota bacterium]